MPFHTNGNGKQWLACCWCPAQPVAIAQDRDDEEYIGLLCLAEAKKAGWLVKNVAGKWLGLCPECQGRGCTFPGPKFVLGFSGNPAT